MPIAGTIGFLAVFFFSIGHSQSVYRPQDTPHDAGRIHPPNGPYTQQSPAISPQYVLHHPRHTSYHSTELMATSQHGDPQRPFSYTIETDHSASSGESSRDDDSQYEDPEEQPKSLAYQRAAEFQQVEEKPQYSRTDDHTLLRYITPTSYDARRVPDIPEAKYSSSALPPSHSSSHVSNEATPTLSESPPYPAQNPAPYAPKPYSGDAKLPQYFTMYEKRVIADPTEHYGKGPWRYLTYGHGITYGSKEPGKVFEKGYGYIRALGRDHCQLPEHLCPPRDNKPFEYEGRKEPYFGYRPH